MTVFNSTTWSHTFTLDSGEGYLEGKVGGWDNNGGR
jgi:hypothetical protein